MNTAKEMRGFVTLATGNDFYYEMARNLVRSYRLHNKKYRFAILCDRENEYTKEFDDIIIMDNVSFSYKDKFRLLTDCPYDENIFIEADCLVYRNLDHFWDLLSKEYDFSCFGWNDGDLGVWFDNKGILKELNQTIKDTNIPIFNPGYLFIRNGIVCKRMFDDVCKIESLMYGRYGVEQRCFVRGQLRDDPLWCLAMKLNHCKCTEKPSKGKCISLPSGYRFKKIDLREGRLNVVDKNDNLVNDCAILHFSTRRAKEEGLYVQQAKVLKSLYCENFLLAEILNSKVFLLVCDLYRFCKTNVVRLVRLWNGEH